MRAQPLKEEKGGCSTPKTYRKHNHIVLNNTFVAKTTVENVIRDLRGELQLQTAKFMASIITAVTVWSVPNV